MRNVVIGFLGTQLDSGKRKRWKPSVSLCNQPDFPVDRLELLYDQKFLRLAENVRREIEVTSPKTEVLLRQLNLSDPWDFQEVYGKLFDLARDYGFDEDRERYFVHLTTGTHVAQICWFLLTESRHVPAKLAQTGPPRDEKDGPGKLDIIDLDLSRYNALQQRFDLLAREYSDLLKGGIETKSAAYNAVIDRIELVASSSDAPILLLGDSGTGKTELAQRIYELKLQRRRVKGRLVQINCATLRGSSALATLFGQRRSHTGQAGSERSGLLHEASGGVLFLDEVDELGLDEQAALLHAIETGRYYPLGSDHEVTSRFQVIAGTSRDPVHLTAEGRFRPDLLARLNMWSFRLPALRDRREDIEANLIFELARAERELGTQVGFNTDARDLFLRFARDPATLWPGNFRDFGSAIRRLCTLAPRGRITRAMVEEEIKGLRTGWQRAAGDGDHRLLIGILGNQAAEIDPFDRVQLAEVIRVCRTSASLSEAGRRLFAVSRTQRRTTNDADRLRKYLQRFGLEWAMIAE
ncbi:RNA repair transcriptional activator RtcR [Ruegeria pomeroyi]|uniref:Transcriptional regulator RtcR n=2 Tax=Ruegeria pomeroyi TaxID=89184 RepID=Q5LWU7_RUEPO|nr:RNA repair transcriptional activator RtcR [Ruegeria pomeroyi]HCE70453.1 transcriptional regulator [Ruegeria sp.]AAV93484.1 transcriptional regulator RtcR [Ruegeria pomeroyi DSS-3]NVK96548.1 sigma 54-interacting transcriptional regulator [Ruegeria pomeroyi]NVL01573.1 sigma 54-interacting transcriptional regulator [Ruegeria pomeroyi]QWV10777.1 RNA repair transcriptional activator RtcR [Ruegeria pomeroyi]